jgi:hypothetical protein
LIMSSIRRIVIAASVANCRRPSKPDFSTVLQSSWPSWMTWMWLEMVVI